MPPGIGRSVGYPYPLRTKGTGQEPTKKARNRCIYHTKKRAFYTTFTSQFIEYFHETASCSSSIHQTFRPISILNSSKGRKTRLHIYPIQLQSKCSSLGYLHRSKKNHKKKKERNLPTPSNPRIRHHTRKIPDTIIHQCPRWIQSKLRLNNRLHKARHGMSPLDRRIPTQPIPLNILFATLVLGQLHDNR